MYKLKSGVVAKLVEGLPRQEQGSLKTLEQGSNPEIPISISLNFMSTDLVGYECAFVSQPPKRSECPICLLVLR